MAASPQLLPRLPGPFEALTARYLAETPSAARALGALTARAAAPLCVDHVALRSFRADGLGIDAVERELLVLGLRPRGQLAFPERKLLATWFAVDADDYDAAPLPRVFVSELLVDQLSPEAQRIIAAAAADAAAAPSDGGLLAAAGAGLLPWHGVQPASAYRALARESEYAAWVFANGFRLNHAAVAVHRLPPHARGTAAPTLEAVNALMAEQGLRLSEEGGVVKRSPDGAPRLHAPASARLHAPRGAVADAERGCAAPGLLRQSSLVADLRGARFTNSDGEEGEMRVPGAYIEFAERAALAEHAALPPEALRERHRRDGFEAANATHIFASTDAAAAKR